MRNTVNTFFQTPELVYELYLYLWRDTPQFTLVSRGVHFSLAETRLFGVARFLNQNKGGTAAFSHAAKLGHFEMLRDLVRFSGGYNCWDYSVALHFAASSGTVECARYLLSLGADINYDYAFPGVITEAARNGRVEMVQFLLSCGSKIKQCQIDNALVLVNGAESDSLKICQMLCDAGADVQFSQGRALTAAATCGHLDIVTFLLLRGCCVRANGNQALFEASKYGHLAIIRVLLAATRNDPFAVDSALGWAIAYSKTDTVSMLLNEYEANLEYISESAIYAACISENLDILELFLAKGATFERAGDRCLMAAASRGFYAIVRFLVRNGCDLHCYEDEPLFLAASRGHTHIVAFLLLNGANAKTAGSKALPFAIENECWDIIKMLFDAGATVDEFERHSVLESNFYYKRGVLQTLLRAFQDWKLGLAVQGGEGQGIQATTPRSAVCR